MNTPFENFPKNQGRIVYVRAVPTTDLPDELREQIGAVEVIYSVHAPDGQQLALAADRDTAFVLARNHDFSPVSVH